MGKIITKIDEHTSLSFKIAVPIIVAIIGATWTVAGKLGDIERKLGDTWSVRAQVEFAHQLQEHNKTLKVPYVHGIITSQSK